MLLRFPPDEAADLIARITEHPPWFCSEKKTKNSQGGFQLCLSEKQFQGFALSRMKATFVFNTIVLDIFHAGLTAVIDQLQLAQAQN